MKIRIILFTFLLLLIRQYGQACTNLLITPGASADGSSMVSYAADSHTRYGALFFYPAGLHPAGAMRAIFEYGTNRPLGSIPEAAETYNVIGNMNEHQLVIGESTWGGCKLCRDPQGGLDYGSLMFLCLQRCKTAREAIALFVRLADTYGYASSGESISFADPHEVWMMDVIGRAPKMEGGENVSKGVVYVAIRIPDGCISAHANQARIRRFPWHDPENCRYAPDVASHARALGLYEGTDEDFSFADAYGPAGPSTVRGCDARVWSFFRRHGAEDMEAYLPYASGEDLSRPLPLYVKAAHKLSVKDVADMMRDHYEDTPFDMRHDIGAGGHALPYRWRPMDFEVAGTVYENERAICTQQTGFWFVGQCRPGFPEGLGGIFWFAVDDAGTSPLTPIYTCSTEVPAPYAIGRGASMLRYHENSMFWCCNRIAQFAYLRYDQIGAEVRTIIDRHETETMATIPAVDRAARLLWEKDAVSAKRFLTGYSVRTAGSLFSKWKELDRYLLVKYIDGNIKRQDPDGRFTHNAWSDSIPPAPMYGGYNRHWQESVAGDSLNRMRATRK